MIISNSPPSHTANPPYTPYLWTNTTTGEVFVCVRNAKNDNKWVGCLGTTIWPYGLPSSEYAPLAPTETQTKSFGIIDGVLITYSNSDHILRVYKGADTSSLDYSVTQPDGFGFSGMDIYNDEIYVIRTGSSGYYSLGTLNLETAVFSSVIDQLIEYTPADFCFVEDVLFVADANGGSLGKYVDFVYVEDYDLSSNLGYTNLNGVCFDGKNLLLSFYGAHMVAMKIADLNTTNHQPLSDFTKWYDTLFHYGMDLYGYDDDNIYRHGNSVIG